MVSDSDVRALCEQADLPVTDSDVAAITPLYRLVVTSIVELAEIIEGGDTIPLVYEP